MGLITGTPRSYYEGNDFGSYQFVNLADLANNFIMAYVGEDKIISKVKRTDVLFHTRRAIQELSFDTIPSDKSYEAELGPALSFVLPQDYVNYIRFSYVDNDGIERIIYPTNLTNNPTSLKGTADNPTLSGDNLDLNAESTSLTRFKAADNEVVNTNDDRFEDDDLFDLYRYGRRYGLEPEHVQVNGLFYIDQTAGVARFSSALAGQIIKLAYLSDGVGSTDQKVHKFAEEAIYKYIAHAILATRANTPEYQVSRFKKEARAAKRSAKLRLSNLKISELARVMRNQSKWIKH
tara:strand:+ start:363 stop:1238 length:876 start_codon:yes stop_codon:yes gene_type:complete